jgi:hypothetical protein
MAKDLEIIPPPKKRKLGRPSNWSEELGNRICVELAKGESLNAICKREGFPDLTTVYDYLRRDPSFAHNYARAKSDSADTLAAKIIDVIENSTPETVNVDRLKVDAYKWIAAKLKPKSYGERVQAELTGKDGGPIQTMSVTLDAGNLAPEARELLRQTLIGIKTGEDET